MSKPSGARALLAPGDSAAALPGIGPKRAAALESAGLRTVQHLLQFLPRRYLDRRRITPLSGVRAGEFASVSGAVKAVRRSGRDGLTVVLSDGQGELPLVFYHGARFLAHTFKTGVKLNAWGTVAFAGRERQMAHPGVEVLTGGEAPRLGVFPHYSLPLAFSEAGLTDKVIQGAVRGALDALPANLPEILPRQTAQRRGFPPLKEVYAGLHFPKTGEPQEIAALANRLKYEEAYLICLQMALRREGSEGRGLPLSPQPALREKVSANLGFSLTPAQARTLGEIERDLLSGRPLRRLLQGDVGSGKTAVCALAATSVLGSGYQVALMAPTEILARQHWATFQKLFSGTKIEMAYLSGGMKAAERREILKRIAGGEVHLVIGTHAVFGGEIVFQKLGLAVVDEQHRFGVGQRLALSRKGLEPHLLVVSATPIPRTLALTLYGDLGVSVIDGLPPGRRPVETHRVPALKRADMYDFIRKRIATGGRAFFVFPLVEASERLKEVKSVTAFAALLRKEAFPGLRVETLHGRMTPEEKNAALQSFRLGESKVLAATAVVEVGVDIPEADVMVVENAERFGLAQLHQLRGRVGRGGRDSFCFLLPGETCPPEAAERLGKFAQTRDGFEIAELDFETRGPGQLSGLAQSGAPEFRFLNLTSDLRVIECAREDARETARVWESLPKGEQTALRRALKPYAGLRGELLETG